MRSYIARRLLLMIPTLFLVSILVYFLVDFIPGDIIDAMQAIPGTEEELDRAALERKLGLDAPVVVQYARWLGVVPGKDGSFNGVLQGNLGTSWWRQKPVVTLIALKWPITLELGILALIISQLIALPVGMYSAIRQDTWGDYLSRSFAIVCISVPAFWLGTLAIVLPSVWWGHMPPMMLIPFARDPIGHVKMFILPAFVLGMSSAGLTMRMGRTMMLEVLRQDYIRTAWSKGLKEKVVVVRHALKNALIPVITVVGLRVPFLIGGTVIIESIFNLPGMGRLLVTAMNNRDHPLVSGVMLLFAVGLVVTNLLVDLAYGFLDPRVHYK
jgi:peptide/nickel transport system permease protein